MIDYDFMDTRKEDAKTDYKVICIVENYMGSIKTNWLSFWLSLFCYGVSVCMDPGNRYRSSLGCGFCSPLSEVITSALPQTHAVGEFYWLSLDLYSSDVFVLFHHSSKIVLSIRFDQYICLPLLYLSLLYYMCCCYWLGTY